MKTFTEVLNEEADREVRRILGIEARNIVGAQRRWYNIAMRRLARAVLGVVHETHIYDDGHGGRFSTSSLATKIRIGFQKATGRASW